MGTESSRAPSTAVRERRRPTVATRVVGTLPPAVRGPVAEAGGMGQLLWATLSTAVRNPRGYWGAVRDEMYDLLKLCWWPAILTVGAFAFLVAEGAINVLLLVGAPNRLGSFFLMASIREFSPFLEAMVVAGIVGTAITADLGARRIREELDALRVLGLDPVRLLVLPRVIAITVMTVMFDVVAIIIGVLAGLVGVVTIGQTSAGAYLGTLLINLTTPELLGTLSKTLLFGIVIGTVCSYKGLQARGGAEGVGRAVNEAVVVSFVCIFVIDFIFTSILLGFNPDILVPR